MHKKITFILALGLSFGLMSFSFSEENNNQSTKICNDEDAFAITLKYYNKDSNDYEFKVKSCGITTKVEFDKSKSSTVTIQSGCSDAIIFDNCKEVKVNTGDKIIIKDGCIKIDG